jgi:hypothetical protein
MAFATVDDLAQRWPGVSESLLSVAEVLLDDAAAIIVAQVGNVADVDEAILRQVSCAMVKRALVGQDLGGVSSLDLQAGPFAERRQFSNPTGDLYLTKAEKSSLGVNRQRAFSIDMIPEVTL